MTEEFDADFQNQLLETISSERMPTDICDTLQDDHRARGIKNERFRELVYRFNRALFAWLCQYSRIDFLGERPRSRAEREITLREKLDRLLRNRTRRTRKNWPYMFGLVCIVCSSMMLTNTYFQYVYNANMAKVDKLKRYIHEGSAQRLGHLDVASLQREFETRASEARQTLNRLGAPHIEWSFINQSIVLTFIISSINLYLIMPLNHVVSGWTLFTPLFILDQQRENLLRAQLILDQLRSFSANSLSYAKSKLTRIANDFAGIMQDELKCNSQSCLPTTSNKVLSVLSRRLSLNHQMTVRQLRSIALQGRLCPLNRSPACRDRLAITCFVAVFLEILYMEVSILSRHRYLQKFFLARRLESESANLKEHLNSFCFIMLIHLHAVSALFLGLILISTWFDQKEATRTLRLLIMHTVRANQSRFGRLVAMTGTRHLSYSCEPPAHAEMQMRAHRAASLTPARRLQPAARFNANKLCQQVEQDVMVVVIQTRLLTRTYELVRGPMSLLGFSAICFATTMLVMFRLHSPYFHPELKSFNTGLAFSCVVSMFVYLIPLGSLHQRCIATYRELWSLAAQVSHFETVAQFNQCPEFGSSVAVFSLRRELADSRLRMDQFACRVATLPITNQNLIRLAFWAFLLIMSFSSNVNLFGDGLAALTTDPFGLFDFA